MPMIYILDPRLDVLQRICRAPLRAHPMLFVAVHCGTLLVSKFANMPGGAAERKYKDDPHLFDIYNTIFWYEESNFGIKK